MINEELKKRKLPNLFQMPNGQIIKTKEEWENIARPYWKKIILREEYGQIPPMIHLEISIKNKTEFSGKTVLEEVSFTFKFNDKEYSVPTQLFYPKNKKELPFFIYLNFDTDILPSWALPVEEILDNGFGLFTVCYNDITRDNGDFSHGLAGLFDRAEDKGDNTGKIVHWSYMASRMMDYLQTRQEARNNAIGVAGHSRLGKTALLTAALDERFAFACVNESGTSGAALSREICQGGETIKDIYERFPFWFCSNYAKYMGNESALPFDQHCLAALVAPRTLYVGGAFEDIWADNDNQFLTCVAASPVWDLYGKKGVVAPNRLPICGDSFMEGNVGFYLRKGTHFLGRDDWRIYMDTLKKKFNN